MKKSLLKPELDQNTRKNPDRRKYVVRKRRGGDHILVDKQILRWRKRNKRMGRWEPDKKNIKPKNFTEVLNDVGTIKDFFNQED